ncbi:MAG: ABC transporter permease [Flavobacteriaceae bacterium]
MTSSGAKASERSTGAWRYLLLVAPSLAVLALFFLLPLADMFMRSFEHFVAYGDPKPGFTLDNYAKFVGDSFYRLTLGKTLTLGAVVAAVSLVIGFPMAYAIVRARSGMRAFLTVIVLVPLMTSVIVRSYGWMILLGESGPIPSLIAALGLPRPRLMYTFAGTVIALVQVMMPFMVLTLAAAIQRISPTLEDASRNLGASRLRMFMDVILPLSLPGIAAGTVLVFSLSISAFATPVLIGGASVKVVATVVFEQALTVINWPFASATSFLLMAVTLLLAFAQARLVAWSSRWAR